MDLATRSMNNHYSIPFVSLFSGGLKECEERNSKGSTSVVFHGENADTEKLSFVLPRLGDILFQRDNNNSPTLYKVVDCNIHSGKKKSVLLFF